MEIDIQAITEQMECIGAQSSQFRCPVVCVTGQISGGKFYTTFYGTLQFNTGEIIDSGICKTEGEFFANLQKEMYEMLAAQTEMAVA